MGIRVVLLGLLILLRLPGSAVEAQSDSDRLELLAGDPIELTAPVQQSLVQLQEEWQQWINGLYTADRDTSEERVANMMLEVRRLGMSRLPELSLAASAQAMHAARRGDGERASWALAAAESLDPGRPETAFRRARVARLEGDWGTALIGWVEGYVRLFRRGGNRAPTSLGLWSAYGLLLAGALWIAFRMAIRGPGWLGALEGGLSSRMPVGVARAVAVLLLLWPLVLPVGLFWLLVYWSVLLWSFASRSEKVVTVALWVLVGLLPGWIQFELSTVELERSPARRALESVAQDRLYGRLFVDLETVVERFPDEPAMVHVLADLHREMQQWDTSRRYYQYLLDLEPENATALIDLGAYYFYNNDFGAAVRFFRQAAEAEPDNVGAWFNLSEAYASAYLYDEMREALQTAQEIDDGLVGRYQDAASETRIITFEGGYERIPRLIRRLDDEFLAEEAGAAGPPAPTPWWALVLVPVCWVAAAGIGRILQRRGVSRPLALWLSHRPGWVGRGLRVLLPGWVSLEEGAGGRAWLALAVPTLLAVLPALPRIAFPLPPGGGGGELLGLAVAGLVAYFAARVWWETSHGY